jgi:hypothetical protein
MAAVENALSDDSMSADWAAIREKFAEPEPEPIVEEAPSTAETTVEEAPALEDARARDDAGRFTKAAKEEPKPAAKVAPAAKTTTAKAPAAPEQTPDAASAQGVIPRDTARAPSTWKPAAREGFEKLPEAARAEIHRREDDYRKGTEQLMPDATFGKSMRQVVDPYRMLIEAEGGSPERAVSDLLRTAAVLRMGGPQEKLNAMVAIVRQFNVDLSPLLQPGQTPQPQQQQFRDPRVDQLLASQAREQQQRAARETQQLETTVTRWLDEADAQGNPKRPYLGDVMSEMSMMIPQLRAADPSLTEVQALEAAYERAIWANPEIRAVLQTKERTELESRSQAANQSRVIEAKRAASVNVPRRASTPSPGKPGDIGDTIRETAQALGLFS